MRLKEMEQTSFYRMAVSDMMYEWAPKIKKRQKKRQIGGSGGA
jgi:hypothetical protein